MSEGFVNRATEVRVGKQEYKFIVVGEKLYRVDTFTGQTWYESHGEWYSVKEHN